MKWPVTGLESRLKASIRKLFRSVQPHREQNKSDTRTLPPTANRNTHHPICYDCSFYASNKQWTKGRCPPESTNEYLGRSPKNYDLHESTAFTELSTSQDALADFSKLETETCSKEILMSDACVTTNEEPIMNVQHNRHQTDDEYNALCTEDVDEISCKRPRMKTTFTQPMQTEHCMDIQPVTDGTNMCAPQRKQSFRFVYAEQLETRHRHDSAPSNYLRGVNETRTEYAVGKYIFAGDSNIRHARSGTHGCEHAVASTVYKTGWSVDLVVGKHSVEDGRTPIKEKQEYMRNRDEDLSFHESAQSGFPAANWNHSVGAISSQSVTNDFRFNAFDDGRRNSALQGSLISEASGLISTAKSTKECGDEDMPPDNRSDATGLIKLGCASKTGRRATFLGEEPSDEVSFPNYGRADSRKGQRELNLTTNPNRTATGLALRDVFNTISSPCCERCASGPIYGSPLVGHQQEARLCTAQETYKHRPATAQPHSSTRVSRKLLRNSVDLQMIHHNCTAVAKEAISQRSDKSEPLTRKHTLYPHSTSDDGDPSKVVRMERSVDRSSASSAYSKPIRVSRTSVQSSGRRNLSKSPVQPWRATKQGGALPASRDLNMCPTGRHLEIKAEKPCICMMVKRMVLAQSKPVLYSWHMKLHKPGGPTSSTTTTILNLPEATYDSGCNPASSTSGSMRFSVPALPNFQLARPTRMVRGGQGTVAWVTDVATGNFYALKFKQREGRSDSTWAIERREAKLLRHARHDFIVRLFHIYETEETLFMALEWLDGGCLWNHIARAGTIPECYAVYYGACILSALRYLHSRFIVYRDMKAENVVLDHRGRPKLIDFGMAKRFAKRDGGKPTPDSTVESSVNDTEDFEQPPTRYYFAAYLAPEIYDHLEKTSQHIDSWGLGYILVEMLLGYGIFSPMPWEQEPGKHLSASWKLKLPQDSSSRISPICEDFVQKMLLRRPEDRMNLEQAQRHTLFARVPWSNLGNIRGPDLSKCPVKPGGTMHTVCTTSGGSRRWVTAHDSLVRVPDLAFVREFYGSLVPANVIYSTQASGLSSRGSKIPKIVQGKSNRLGANGRNWTSEAERSQPASNALRNKATMPGHAIEIRSTQPLASESTKEVTRSNRTNRRHVGSST